MINNKGSEMDESEPLIGNRGITNSSGTDSLTDERLQVVGCQSWKNLLSLSVAFAFIFTAYASLQNLESSLNQEGGLGLISLSTIYGCVIVSCLFAPWLIDVLGTKWTMVGCSLCYCIYTAVNFSPSYGTMIPGSIVLGLAAAPLWSAQGVYLTTSAIEYSRFSEADKEAVINRFNGVFLLVFQFSQVTGNIISSAVLYTDSDAELADSTNDAGPPVCGKLRCPGANNSDDSIPEPQRHLEEFLLTIYLSSGLLGFLVLLVFLDQQNPTGTEHGGDWLPPSHLSRLMASIKLLTDWKLLLLIPIIIYAGVEQAIMGGVFTEAYISCSLGIHLVGYVMAVAALVDAVASAIFGRLNKLIGRISIFTIGFAFHLGLYLAQIVWKSNWDQTWTFFLLAAIWGVGDAVWQSQITSLLGVIFSEKQKPAFANLTLWRSVGFTITFAYSNSACVATKLYVTLALLIFSFILYVILEILLKLKLKG